jgi:hypothetical protein
MRTTAVVINWSAMAVLIVGIGFQLTDSPSRFRPEGILPFLAYATAAASYHVQPRRAVVWASLALNGFVLLLALIGLGVVLVQGAERFLLAAAAIVLAVVLPTALNAWSLWKMERGLP